MNEHCNNGGPCWCRDKIAELDEIIRVLGLSAYAYKQRVKDLEEALAALESKQ